MPRDFTTDLLMRRLDQLERDIKHIKEQMENDRIAMEERISSHETDYIHKEKPVSKDELEMLWTGHEVSR
jgi:hypothetical protein